MFIVADYRGILLTKFAGFCFFLIFFHFRKRFHARFFCRFCAFTFFLCERIESKYCHSFTVTNVGSFVNESSGYAMTRVPSKGEFPSLTV